MLNKIYHNIIQSVIEKVFILGSQFVLSFVLIRLLKRADYGIIGVVAGYFVFVNMINISLESIMLRDHKDYEDQLEKIFSNFIFFNLIKSIVIIITAIILSVFLVNIHNDFNFVYAIAAISFKYIGNSLVAPFSVYTTAKFNQKLVTKISTIRSILDILFTAGLLVYPSLFYVAFKNLLVYSTFVIIWLFYSKSFIKYTKVLNFKNIDFEFLKNSLLNYSLWTHINGVVTNFIYKSDTFFLSFFVSLSIIGDYNVALTNANIANILPMIFGYQNSVALSHSRDIKHAYKISNGFIRLSIYVGSLTMIGFIFFGKIYLKLITGQENVQNIYFYMLFIVAGLVIIKSFSSPLNSFVNIKGSVKSLFKTVLLPSFLITSLLYLVSAKFWGAIGVSIANIINSLIWLILMIREVKKYDYEFESILEFKNDYKYVKELIKNGFKD